MKKQLLIIPSILFLLILSTFFYLLIIERNPLDLPSNLLNKNVPIFESESLLKNENFVSSKEFGKGIRVIGINYKDNSGNAIEWLKNLGNPYSDVPVDKNGRIAIDWGVYGIPETFIVNSKGIIKYRHVGPITKKIYKKINLLIKEIEQ